MSNLRNRVQLIGHLGMDPEVKEFESTKLVNVSIATKESYKTSSGEWKDETTWHRVTMWGSIADRAIAHLRKGNFVMMEGKLVNRDYTTPQGEKRYVTEIRVSSFMLLEKREKSEHNITTDATVVQEPFDDGLPF